MLATSAKRSEPDVHVAPNANPRYNSSRRKYAQDSLVKDDDAMRMDDASNADVVSAAPCELARQVIRTEAAALQQLANQLPAEFTAAVRTIFDCPATVILTGIGKAGLIAQKLVATFGSTGTPAHFLHPSEAVHGDLGRIHSQDIIILLSYSGETEEITRLIPALKKLDVTTIAITADPASSLGRSSHIVLELGRVEEVWYSSTFDQRKLQGWFVKPPAFDPQNQYPLIVEIHGGPVLNYGDRFSGEIQLMASAGYVVFYPNFRGSTGYGEEFGNLLYNNYPGDDYQDIMDGVDVIRFSINLN